MNNYLVFINGALMTMGLFEFRSSTSPILGRFMQATVEKEKLKKALDGQKISRIQVEEIRASSLIKVYEYHRPDGEEPDENYKNLPANKAEGLPERALFKMLGVPNAF